MVDGLNLKTTLAVSPWEAALGAKVPLTLLDGKTAMLTIKPGSQSGTHGLRHRLLRHGRLPPCSRRGPQRAGFPIGAAAVQRGRGVLRRTGPLADLEPLVH